MTTAGILTTDSEPVYVSGGQGCDEAFSILQYSYYHRAAGTGARGMVVHNGSGCTAEAQEIIEKTGMVYGCKTPSGRTDMKSPKYL